MNQAVPPAKSRHGAEHCVAHAEALALVRAGRLQAARLSSNRAVDLALQAGQREALAFSWESFRSEALAGDLEKGLHGRYFCRINPYAAFSGPETIGNRSVTWIYEIKWDLGRFSGDLYRELIDVVRAYHDSVWSLRPAERNRLR